jgi:hypothetical protein
MKRDPVDQKNTDVQVMVLRQYLDGILITDVEPGNIRYLAKIGATTRTSVKAPSLTLDNHNDCASGSADQRSAGEQRNL